MTKTLYLLDTYNVIFRSYFAFIQSPLRNAKGENTSAIFGLFRTILMILKTYTPQYFVAVMDSRTPTFRHTKFSAYKATRNKTPDDLIAQIPRIEQLFTELNITSVRIDGYEADDVIASYVRECTRLKWKCKIISTDKDLMQLIDEQVVLLKPSGANAFTTIDAAAVVRDKGVKPIQIGDYLALIGDSSDNIPGVQGIGPKSAQKLLENFGTLSNIYQSIEQVPSAMQKKLQADADNAKMSRELVELVSDLSVEPSVELLQPVTITVSQQGEQLLYKENMKALLKELQEYAGQLGATTASTTESEGVAKSTDTHSSNATDALQSVSTVDVQTPAHAGDTLHQTDNSVQTDNTTSGTNAHHDDMALHGHESYQTKKDVVTYQLVSTDEECAQIFEELKGYTHICIDIETDNIDPMQAKPIGFSIAVRADTAWYLPLEAPDGAVLSSTVVKEGVRAIVSDPSKTIIGHNIKYDIKVMLGWGIDVIPATIHDTMVAAWLLDPTLHSYSMDALAERYLNYTAIPFPDEAKKNGFASVELQTATAYACEDADITLRLHTLCMEQLRNREQLSSIFLDVEMPMLAILIEMEFTGIILDNSTLGAYRTTLQGELEKVQQSIYDVVGHTFNINSTKQLQVVLFEELQLKPIKKTKTGYSTNTQVLQLLANQHQLPSIILRYRLLQKLLSTYIDSLPQLINPDTKRIHTTFNITGTATGRISSNDPNLQNIPIKDVEGREIRKSFIPQPGWVFMSADYAQIELAILAHLSKDAELVTAFKNQTDIHARTGSLIFGVPESAISSEQRRLAKTINFGVMYGMSSFRLSNELSISMQAAKEFISSYFKHYSGVESYIQTTIESAKQQGGVASILGRWRFIPDINNSNAVIRQGAERIAINTPIQGSAADVIKLSMMAVYKSIRRKQLQSRLLLQVHDELLLEVPHNEIDDMTGILQHDMTTTYTLDVPLRISLNVGDNWGDLK